MPFGLRNAPSVFRRINSNILNSFIIKREMIVYMDNILIGADTLFCHNDILVRVLRCLKDNGLEIQPSKCRFG